ncbi:MAG: amino acid permease [Flavobacteriaceae bacterium]|nr:amino acid permease [Flavobacteriaceae bacterium]|tara:strand:+ start:6359 stop:7642 length:1284 start_codon:yes stop_codon:yes gene_type:complete
MNKGLGIWSSVSLVIGNMIGSGIFLLPATLALYGLVSILGWIIAAIGAILLAIVFGELSKLFNKEPGGPYKFTKNVFGDFPAFLVAWGYWISIWSTNAAIVVALLGYLSVFFPSLSTSPIISIFTGLFIIWFFTWINSRKINTVGLVQQITVVLKVIPIILVGIIGLLFIDIQNFSSLSFSNDLSFNSLTITTTLTFFAFLGMESATIPSDKVNKASETIKKATFYGTLFTIIIYLLSTISIMGIIPPNTLAESSAPFADAAEHIAGESFRKIVAFGAVIATMGALNGWILIQGQIPMAASKDNLFPKIFSKTNKHNSPILGIILSSVLISVLMLFNFSKTLVEAFTFMIKLSTLSVITPYIFSTACLAILSKKNIYRLIISFFAFIFSIWIIIGCGIETITLGLFMLLAGIPFYFIFKRNKTISNG